MTTKASLAAERTQVGHHVSHHAPSELHSHGPAQCRSYVMEHPSIGSVLPAGPSWCLCPPLGGSLPGRSPRRRQVGQIHGEWKKGRWMATGVPAGPQAVPPLPHPPRRWPQRAQPYPGCLHCLHLPPATSAPKPRPCP